MRFRDRFGIRRHRGETVTKLDREATAADIEALISFARDRRGVEFYIEPETFATDTTAVAVAHDGEWTRRRVPSVRWAHEFCNDRMVPSYDAALVGVPQRMRDYYRAWTKTVLADGRYRPGIYAHTRNAGTIYEDVADVYDEAGVDADPPFWIAGKGSFGPGRSPTEVGHSFATAWQGVLDVVREHNGVKLPVDISVASVPSPSLTQ